jgi:CheY-like chemotaxis protein
MGKKVLIADDNQDILKALTIRLRSGGYDVVTATDGLQAVMKAHKEKPDLAILDIMMPAGDGLSVKEKLNMGPDTWQIPVIFLTASPRPDLEEKARETGGLFFIRKPYDPDDLMKCVRIALQEPEEVGEVSLS